jgi:hypothetical protein
MSEELSKQSIKYKQKHLTTIDVFDLAADSIDKSKLLTFLKQWQTDTEIPTSAIYEFFCQNIDFTSKQTCSSLNNDLKLFMRVRNHEVSATWYKDSYTPYCCQTAIKCSSPRMRLESYGYSCPDCKNEISFIGLRLQESPLNLLIKRAYPTEEDRMQNFAQQNWNTLHARTLKHIK